MTRKIGPFTLQHQAQFGLNPAPHIDAVLLLGECHLLHLEYTGDHSETFHMKNMLNLAKIRNWRYSNAESKQYIYS